MLSRAGRGPGCGFNSDSRADTNYLIWHNQPRARPHVEGWKRSVHSQRGTTKIRDGAYAPHFSRSHNERAAELTERKKKRAAVENPVFSAFLHVHHRGGKVYLGFGGALR